MIVERVLVEFCWGGARVNWDNVFDCCDSSLWVDGPKDGSFHLACESATGFFEG